MKVIRNIILALALFYLPISGMDTNGSKPIFRSWLILPGTPQSDKDHALSALASFDKKFPFPGPTTADVEPELLQEYINQFDLYMKKQGLSVQGCWQESKDTLVFSIMGLSSNESDIQGGFFDVISNITQGYQSNARLEVGKTPTGISSTKLGTMELDHQNDISLDGMKNSSYHSLGSSNYSQRQLSVTSPGSAIMNRHDVNEDGWKGQSKNIGNIYDQAISRSKARLAQGDIPQLDADGHTGRWYSGARYIAVKEVKGGINFVNGRTHPEALYDKNLKVIDLENPHNKVWIAENLKSLQHVPGYPDNIRLLAREYGNFACCALNEFIDLPQNIQSTTAAQNHLYNLVKKMDLNEISDLPTELQNSVAVTKRIEQIEQLEKQNLSDELYESIWQALDPEAKDHPQAAEELKKLLKTNDIHRLRDDAPRVVASFNRVFGKVLIARKPIVQESEGSEMPQIEDESDHFYGEESSPDYTIGGDDEDASNLKKLSVIKHLIESEREYDNQEENYLDEDDYQRPQWDEGGGELPEDQYPAKPEQDRDNHQKTNIRSQTSSYSYDSDEHEDMREAIERAIEAQEAERWRQETQKHINLAFQEAVDYEDAIPEARSLRDLGKLAMKLQEDQEKMKEQQKELEADFDNRYANRLASCIHKRKAADSLVVQAETALYWVEPNTFESLFWGLSAARQKQISDAKQLVKNRKAEAKKCKEDHLDLSQEIAPLLNQIEDLKKKIQSTHDRLADLSDKLLTANAAYNKVKSKIYYDEISSKQSWFEYIFMSPMITQYYFDQLPSKGAKFKKTAEKPVSPKEKYEDKKEDKKKSDEEEDPDKNKKSKPNNLGFFNEDRLHAIDQRFGLNLSYQLDDTIDPNGFHGQLYECLDDLEKLNLPSEAESAYTGTINHFTVAAQEFHELGEQDKADGMLYVLEKTGEFFSGFFGVAKEEVLSELISYVPGTITGVAITACVAYVGLPWIGAAYAIGGTLYNIYRNGGEFCSAVNDLYAAVRTGTATDVGKALAHTLFVSKDTFAAMQGVYKMALATNGSKKVAKYLLKGFANTNSLTNNAGKIAKTATQLTGKKSKPMGKNFDCDQCKLYPPKKGKSKRHHLNDPKAQKVRMKEKEKELIEAELRKKLTQGKDATSIVQYNDVSHNTDPVLICYTDENGLCELQISGGHFAQKLNKMEISVVKTKTSRSGCYEAELYYKNSEGVRKTFFPDDSSVMEQLMWGIEGYYNPIAPDTIAKNGNILRYGKAIIRGKKTTIQVVIDKNNPGTILTAIPWLNKLPK